jgi:hypothetical protein
MVFEERPMGFGAGIFLLTAGAILTFAIRVSVWWIDVDAAGLVLMLSGVAVLAVTAWYWRSRRRPVTYPPVYREVPATPPVTTWTPPPGLPTPPEPPPPPPVPPPAD